MRLVALVLLVGLFAGCTSDACPTCATPTDHVSPPVVTNAPHTIPPNYNDAGYAMTQGWHVGDQWDYQSNLSNARTVKVLGGTNRSGHVTWQLLEVFTTNGKTTRAYSSVSDGNYTRMNLSTDTGVSQSYAPWAPLRFTRNATYGYNVTTVDPPEQPVTRTVVVRTQYSGLSTRTLPWGNARAGRIDETDKTGSTQSLVTHWVSADYGNDIFFVVNGEEYHLVAAHVGDRYYNQDNLKTV